MLKKALIASVAVGALLGLGPLAAQQIIDGPPQAVVVMPSNATSTAINAVLTNSITSVLIIKPLPGNLYSVIATNASAVAGFLLMYDRQTIPNDGAVAPKDCRVIPASGTVTIEYRPGPSDQYISGIVAVMSTTGCYTKTSGAVSGFLKGSAQ